MTWWMVVLCIIGYLLVGIVVSGLFLACIGDDDEIDAAGITLIWPAAILVSIFLVFYKVIGKGSIWVGKFLVSLCSQQKEEKRKKED